MAEETDNAQKPKAELIKRAPGSAAELRSSQENLSPAESGEPSTGTQGEPSTSPDGAASEMRASRTVSRAVSRVHENADGIAKTTLEHGERRKVIVVKKKPPSASNSPQAAPSGMVKKTMPKVVIARSQEGGSSEAGYTKGKTQRKDNTAGAPKEKAPPSQAHNGKEESGHESPTFLIAQRPIAAAGRVGGKYVGPRPSHEDANRGTHQGQRPQGPVGKTGGRLPGRGTGDNRQGGFGPNRTFTGPARGGRPQGSPHPGGSHPGGFAQNRPLGGPGKGPPRPGAVKPAGFTGPQGTQAPSIEGKGPAKKSFKAKKAVYTRKEKELEMEEKLLQTKKKITQIANPVPKTIEIMEVVSVSELARKMNLKASDLIQKLMAMGQMVTINQQIDSDTATILASEFGADVKIVSLYDETLIETASDNEADMASRPPVVTVMGHVDHGKTKLLDAIRSADVVAGEFGGITQHIGAYTVETPNGKITFLDTPGHEAFTKMRARGAQVTDIVVLVVAADDGVMPQTVEAINHAKEADVPIIVAVNKIDKPEANPDRVRTQLSDHQLIPEAWGGQTMFVEVSALKKQGIDKLIETILLQAEILDIKANYNRSAEGKVLESRIDHGRGIVATVMVQKGTLKIGDSFVAGVWPGKVRALFTDKGEKVDEALPSMPIEVIGFEGVPNAGDPIQVVEEEKTARSVSAKRKELKRFEDSKSVRKITLDNLHDTISEGAIQELKVIIKADVQGSAEALRSSLEKLSTKEIRLHVIQALPGAINEGDVDLSIASNAIIIGFNVRPVPKAKALAEQEKVEIRRYNVIYKAVEEIQLAMEGMLKPETREETIATVEVRDTFKTPKFGVVAGCYVQTGTIKRSAGIHVIRDSIVIHSGKIASLRRFKDDAREVSAGFECGIGLENFDDIKAGDQFEAYEIVEVARKLGSSTS